MSAEPAKRNSAAEMTRTAILIAFGYVLLNGLFFALSYAYYKANSKDLAEGAGLGMQHHVIDRAALWSVRETFLVMTVLVAGAIFIATRLPRELGHGLALLFGLAALTGAYGAFDKSLPAVMGVTLSVIGLLLPVLAYLSWQKSRAAWSFLIALVAVFGGVMFFGAPKVRGVLGVGLWTVMVVPMLQIVAVMALAACRADYRAPTAAAKA